VSSIRVFFVLVLAFLVLPGCAEQSCHCDLIAAESECIQFSATDNPLYATQLSATCSSVLEGLCTTLGGAYTFGASCPTADAVAECAVSFPNYNEKDIYYSTGGNPVAAGSREPDDDCSGNGVVTWY